MGKLFRALLLQFVALSVLAIAVYLLRHVFTPPYSVWVLVLMQAGLAAALSWRLPVWWRWIQFLLPLGLYGASLLQVNPWLSLLIFVLLWLVFANVNKERVPLYLTNSVTRQALKVLAEERFGQQGVQQRFVDLGCGLAGNVVYMSRLPQIEHSLGVETAPLPYFISRLHVWWRGGEVRAQDLWKTDLSGFDVVYAFLSPEPMPKLWHKVQQEMRAGSVFVSNSFAVPGVEPSQVWELSDRRQTRLYLYEITTSSMSLPEKRVAD
ncbi:MAG: hypothetical protein IE920_00185 [Thiotrichales bacterium]|nr:hypothetical protein [Thiotrichales bacterium]